MWETVLEAGKVILSPCFVSVNCWPSVSGGESYVNIEYEASKAFELQNVVIHIPLPALHDVPAVNQVDGEWRLVGAILATLLFSLTFGFLLQLSLQIIIRCEPCRAALGMILGIQCWSGPSRWSTIQTEGDIELFL